MIDGELLLIVFSGKHTCAHVASALFCKRKMSLNNSELFSRSSEILPKRFAFQLIFKGANESQMICMFNRVPESVNNTVRA